jgi:hypothetical protein
VSRLFFWYLLSGFVIFWYNNGYTLGGRMLNINKITYEYEKLTGKQSPLDGKIENILEEQNLFFEQNPELLPIYLDMLGKYNYYSKENIQSFLKSALSEEEIDFVFTYLRSNNSRFESSSIIAPLLFEVEKNSRAKAYSGLTTKLFEDVIEIKQKLQKHAELRRQDGIDIKEIKSNLEKIKQESIAKGINNYRTLKKIIIFEDFVGTGRALVEKFLSNNIKQLKQLKKLKIDICFLILEMSSLGEQKITDFIKKNALDNINYIKLKNEGFCSYEPDEDIDKIGSKLGMKEGKYSLKALVSTYLETPNNTISYFWQENSNWKPLFYRTNKTLVQNESELLALNNILKKYDFRKSQGVNTSNTSFDTSSSFSSKLGLMLIVLLRDGQSSTFENVCQMGSKVFNQNKESLIELIELLHVTKYIKINSDDSSTIELTEQGEYTAKSVKTEIDWKEFIDESVLW